LLVEAIVGTLLAYDAVLADRGNDVPAVDMLARVWSVPPLAAVSRGVPRPVPTWDEFSQAYEHLLGSRNPLSWDEWAAAADFAEDVGRSDPVAGILLGILVAAGWQDSEEGNERDMLRDDARGWRAVFLPLARSLLGAEAAWSARALCRQAIDNLTGVGWYVADDVGRFRVLQQFRQAEAEAAAMIEAAAKELVWRLAPDEGDPPDFQLDLAALCWLLGDAARAAVLSSPGGRSVKDCAEFVVRRSLADVPRDPFLEAGWQRLAEAGVIDKSPDFAPIYYRLTRTSQLQMLELDRAVPSGTAGRMSRLVYENLKTSLSGRPSEVDLRSLNELLDQAKDTLWHDFRTAYLRLVALLLASSGMAPTSERWEWEKLAHGACVALWDDTVDNVAATSADRAADLPFYFLPSQSDEDLTGTLELVEAYRSAGLEYALSVTPATIGQAQEGAAGRSPQDDLRSELRGLRFLLARGRLPAHTRRYYAPEEQIAPDGPLSPTQLFDAERNRARQKVIRAELERSGAGIFAEPKGYGCMRPGSGRVLIDFRRALGYHPGEPRSADDNSSGSASRATTESDEFDRRLSRARSLREGADLPGARKELEDAIAWAQTTYGPDAGQVAEASNALGNVLQSLDDPAAAQQCYFRALAIHQAVHGFVHESVATDRHNLGTAAFRLGEIPNARVQLERAVGIDAAVYGPQHLEVATDRMALGEVLTALGQFDRASQQYRNALAIYTEIYGPDHPRTAKAAAALDAAEALTLGSAWLHRKER